MKQRIGESIQHDDFVSRLIHYGWDRAFLFLRRVRLSPLSPKTPGGRAKF